MDSFIYLLIATRPDVAYAVRVVFRNLENPTTTDYYTIYKVLIVLTVWDNI